MGSPMASIAADSAYASRATPRPRATAIWLFVVAAMVFAILVVGGITRLTESGLSIVKWNVVAGTLPPLSDAGWQAEFAQYQASPQYALINHGMTLAAFKGIFFWEYLHRLLARLLGLVVLGPFLLFWWRRAIPTGFKPRLLGLLALVALEPAVGWWMVKSGLSDRPAVAPERLATHLVIACSIMAGSIWTALDLIDRAPAAAPRPRRWVLPFAALLATQIIWGAFSAGLRAGHISDTWPLMFGQWVPSGLFQSVADMVTVPATVMFIHRSLAWGVALAALATASLCRAAGVRASLLGGLVALQLALGIATVVSGVAIPLAVAHQAVAALLVAATVWLAHWATRPVA